ncbi:MAG: tRNA 5-methoxyuridine(34)/uridine 5-oxyacetic acid(34) synthase CmoB [Pseudomonadota bacterium]
MTTDLSVDGVIDRLNRSPLHSWTEVIRQALTSTSVFRHGDAPQWQAALDSMPGVSPTAIQLDQASVGAELSIQADELAALEDSLRVLAPWRKGPYRLGPINIDSEWRSDLKWARIASGLPDLRGLRVLDIGGGNSYFAWRAAGAGASDVINVDPTLLFYAQHCAIARYTHCPQVSMVPLTFEALPDVGLFDVVMSMGVLYHRRSPIDHLTDIRQRLKPGGSLLLETLVIPGDASNVLTPPDRYARMRNVWFLPSVKALRVWLARAGFADIDVVDETPTTSQEQRSTDWMPFESLSSAMSEDEATTIEGHPPPLRATLTARTRAAG